MSSETNIEQYSYGLNKTYKPYKVLEKVSTNDIKSTNLTDTFSLIIPAYNEEKRIQPFLEQIVSELPVNWEIIIVIDGNDRTGEIARSFGNRFKIYEYKHKLGKGGAIIEGFKRSTGSIIGYADADGAVSPHEIKRIFNYVTEGPDVAIGSRWVRGAMLETKQPLPRVLLGRLYHYFTFVFLGIKVKDTQCGVKAMRSDVVDRILGKITVNNLSFDTALLYHCKKNSFRVAEIPIKWQDVQGSKVHIIKTSFIMFLSIVGIRMAHSRNFYSFKRIVENIRKLIENA